MLVFLFLVTDSFVSGSKSEVWVVSIISISSEFSEHFVPKKRCLFWERMMKTQLMISSFVLFDASFSLGF